MYFAVRIMNKNCHTCNEKEEKLEHIIKLLVSRACANLKNSFKTPSSQILIGERINVSGKM